MKLNLIISLFAAALLGSGVANAAQTLKASYYNGGSITLGSEKPPYDTLAVNVPLTLIGGNGTLNLHNGATFVFQKKQAADEICSISTSAELTGTTVYVRSGSYNFMFDDGAQAVVAASAGTPITLIQDLNMASSGFNFWLTSPSDTVLKLNGAVVGQTVNMNGVQFTYVGPQSSDYAFKEGEIGFTGYYTGSHNLSLVANGKPTPEPTTGSLSLLALVALAARRRKH